MIKGLVLYLLGFSFEAVRFYKEVRKIGIVQEAYNRSTLDGPIGGWGRWLIMEYHFYEQIDP